MDVEASLEGPAAKSILFEVQDGIDCRRQLRRTALLRHPFGRAEGSFAVQFGYAETDD